MLRAVLLLLLMAPAALAQGPLDPLAPPHHGLVRLRTGFTPDPSVRNVRAGGPDAVAVAGCTGYVAGAAPTLVLRFLPGRFALTITATPKAGAGEADLVLIVRTPDGHWHCDDDAGGDLRPRLVLRKGRPGTYALWVAAYDAGTPVPARVAFSEIGRSGD